MKFEAQVQPISQTHLHFQEQAAKAVNVALTLRKGLIGCYRVEFEQNGEDRAAYGETLISSLALRLTSTKGADQRSLFHFQELKHQINSHYYERTGLSRKPELLSEITRQKTEPMLPAQMEKSAYTLVKQEIEKWNK